MFKRYGRSCAFGSVYNHVKNKADGKKKHKMVILCPNSDE